MDESRPESRWHLLSSPTVRILIAMVLGGLVGAILGPRVGEVGRIGELVIGLIKMLAAPLILFAVLDTFLRTTIRAKCGLVLLGISAVNAVSAVVVGLILANTLRPGRFLSISGDLSSSPDIVPSVRPTHYLDGLLGVVPTNLVDPFRTNAIAPIVVLAVLAGTALRRYKHERIAAGCRDHLVIEAIVTGALRILELMLGWFVALLPVAIFAVMVQMVGTHGFTPLRGLTAYLGAVILGLLLHVGLVYQSWIRLVARVPLRAFWAALRAPLTCAAGSSSSLATMPVTLRSLKALGISDGSARMSACVMTNLNNDGILLYEAMAALIVAQASGIHLTLGQQLAVSGSCVLASVGIAGIPEAGLISLAVVLSVAELPLDLLPLLLSVDWILGRCRAMTNVVGDVVGAVVLDRLDETLRLEPAPEPTGPVDEPSTLAIVA